MSFSREDVFFRFYTQVEKRCGKRFFVLQSHPHKPPYAARINVTRPKETGEHLSRPPYDWVPAPESPWPFTPGPLGVAVFHPGMNGKFSHFECTSSDFRTESLPEFLDHIHRQYYERQLWHQGQEQMRRGWN